MHMSDALLSPAVAGAMCVASGAAVAASVMKLRRSTEPVKVAEAGVMGAFVFAAQMINFAVPGTGSSGHICGGMLLAAVLGPSLGFLTLAVVLLVQCLLFADGGILALGANIWNMAFYGCLLGGGLIWPIVAGRAPTRGKVFAASVIGNIVALQFGAFSVTLQTLASGVTELPFGAFVVAMQPIHLAIGTVEGLITGSVLCFILEARPEMLALKSRPFSAKFSRCAVLSVLAASAFVVGGLLSLVASSSPDGLEWSIDVYKAVEMGICGLLAHRSVLQGNVPIDVPNFRNPEEREAYRNDHYTTMPSAPEGFLQPITSLKNARERDEQYFKYCEQLWKEGKKFENYPF